MSTKVSGVKKKSQEAKQCGSYSQHNWQKSSWGMLLSKMCMMVGIEPGLLK